MFPILALSASTFPSPPLPRIRSLCLPSQTYFLQFRRHIIKLGHINALRMVYSSISLPPSLSLFLYFSPLPLRRLVAASDASSLLSRMSGSHVYLYLRGRKVNVASAPSRRQALKSQIQESLRSKRMGPSPHNMIIMSPQHSLTPLIAQT